MIIHDTRLMMMMMLMIWWYEMA